MRFDKDVKVKMRELYEARHEPEALRMLAAAYWNILLVLTALLCTGAIGYGAWQFFNAEGADASSVQVRSPQASFNKQQLQALIRKFQERGLKFEERRATPLSIPDPSGGR